MTPRKLTARGEQAREQARQVAAEAARRGTARRLGGHVPPAVVDLVAHQRQAAPPAPMPATDDESEAQQ